MAERYRMFAGYNAWANARLPARFNIGGWSARSAADYAFFCQRPASSCCQ